MSDRLLKESDVMRIAFQLPLVVNSAFADAVKALPSAGRLNDLLDALDSVTWYNGLAEEIMEWKNLPKDDFGITYPEIDDPQIEVIWMICCVLFGDYGTSPRSGWITDVIGFHEFIDAITKTQQKHNEEYGDE